MKKWRAAGNAVGALICALSLPHGVAAELVLPSQAASAGTSIVISAAFSAGTTPVAGLQLDVRYDSTAMSLNVAPGDALRGSLKEIFVRNLDPNTRRFVIVGENQNPIPAGTILSIFVNMNLNASAGLHTLNVINLFSTDSNGNAVATTSTGGGISVQGSAGSRIQPSGVLNAASLVSGPVAPGEIVTLIGSAIGPGGNFQPDSSATSTALGGTSVLFDTFPAPLLYAGPNQINAIVPFEVSGQSSTQMSIMTGGQLVAGFSLPVSAAGPAIFTLDGSGIGPAVVLNQDLSVNSPSNPADRGSVVVVYANGAGMMNPVPVDGQVTGTSPGHPTLPVSVQIGGIDAAIQYQGAAPGLVAGVLQVNCIVPQNITPGDAVGIQLRVGDASSPPGAVVAVR